MILSKPIGIDRKMIEEQETFFSKRGLTTKEPQMPIKFNFKKSKMYPVAIQIHIICFNSPVAQRKYRYTSDKNKILFLEVDMGLRIKKIYIYPVLKKPVVKSKIAAMDPLNNETRHIFAPRRHIFINKLSFYRFSGKVNLLAPTSCTEKCKLLSRFYICIKKNYTSLHVFYP